MKVSENPGEEAQLREALKCIAESRKDHVLLNFIETGSSMEPVIQVNEAFTRLGIPNRDLPDDDTIAVFNLRVSSEYLFIAHFFLGDDLRLCPVPCRSSQPNSIDTDVPLTPKI